MLYSRPPTDSTLCPTKIGGQALPLHSFTQLDASTRQSGVYTEGRLRQPRTTSGSSTLEGISQYHVPESERWQPLQESQCPEGLPITSSMPFLEDFLPPTATPQPGNSQDSTSGTDQSVSPTSTDHLQGPDTGVTVLQHIGGPYRRGSEDHVAVTFSPFLETDFLSSIPSEDFKYLQHTACLQIPQRNNCDELVRAYFLYVHPHLPLIDEGKFWDTYRTSQSSEPSASRMSLFVFRAMLLVACSVSPAWFNPSLSLVSFFKTMPLSA